MRAVLTRVKSASVTIDGKVNGKIGQGFLILLGVGPEDTEKECLNIIFPFPSSFITPRWTEHTQEDFLKICKTKSLC